MRAIVCGGRDYANPKRLFQILDAAVERLGLDFVIQGGQRGADFLAWQWAEVRKLPHMDFQANWKGQGDSAGPIRNKRMMDEGKPDRVIAFPGSAGTASMVRLAREAGVEVIKVDW